MGTALQITTLIILLFALTVVFYQLGRVRERKEWTQAVMKILMEGKGNE